jgi:hypothetical protein
MNQGVRMRNADRIGDLTNKIVHISKYHVQVYMGGQRSATSMLEARSTLFQTNCLAY